MKRAPKSYLNRRRPNLLNAVNLGGKATVEEALESLEKKGYFTSPPRPWKLGYRDRGLGREDYGILDRFGDVVIEGVSKETAELIIKAVNQHEKNNKK